MLLLLTKWTETDLVIDLGPFDERICHGVSIVDLLAKSTVVIGEIKSSNEDIKKRQQPCLDSDSDSAVTLE